MSDAKCSDDDFLRFERNAHIVLGVVTLITLSILSYASIKVVRIIKTKSKNISFMLISLSFGISFYLAAEIFRIMGFVDTVSCHKQIIPGTVEYNTVSKLTYTARVFIIGGDLLNLNRLADFYFKSCALAKK